MGTLFLFGGVFFWLLIIVATILILVATEMEDSNSMGWIIVVITFACLYFGGSREVINNGINYIKDHPIVTLITFLSYFIFGVIWSLIKWYFYLLKLKDENIDLKNYKFFPKNNKERIINWMVYWPISTLWTIIDQPIRRIFNRIYKGVEIQFQRISDKVTGRLK